MFYLRKNVHNNTITRSLQSLLLFFRKKRDLIKISVKKSIIPLYLKLGGLIVFPFLLYIVPLDWLNEQHSICLFKNIFGIECWGCGITRAIIADVQLDFVRAYEFNFLIVIVLPVCFFLWLTWVIKTVKRIITFKKNKYNGKSFSCERSLPYSPI